MAPMFDCALEMPHHFPVEHLFAPDSQSVVPPYFGRGMIPRQSHDTKN
nr:MAG TPA: hypothetical protein [Caudoviricetes sp.]